MSILYNRWLHFLPCTTWLRPSGRVISLVPEWLSHKKCRAPLADRGFAGLTSFDVCGDVSCSFQEMHNF
jgi:hypothetical protein